MRKWGGTPNPDVGDHAARTAVKFHATPFRFARNSVNRGQLIESRDQVVYGGHVGGAGWVPIGSSRRERGRDRSRGWRHLADLHWCSSPPGL